MPSNVNYNIPDLSGKVILITGGTAGLGAQTTLQLSQHSHPPQHIYILGRNASAAETLIDRISAKRQTQTQITFI
ncbi:hypothetical protein BJX70DRAFT_360943 [Aspergillus crustosus]